VPTNGTDRKGFTIVVTILSILFFGKLPWQIASILNQAGNAPRSLSGFGRATYVMTDKEFTERLMIASRVGAGNKVGERYSTVGHMSEPRARALRIMENAGHYQFQD
jgi:hypothetical protein